MINIHLENQSRQSLPMAEEKMDFAFNWLRLPSKDSLEYWDTQYNLHAL